MKYIKKLVPRRGKLKNLSCNRSIIKLHSQWIALLIWAGVGHCMDISFIDILMMQRFLIEVFKQEGINQSKYTKMPQILPKNQQV